MICSIGFINPQSYNILEKYDYNLLDSCITEKLVVTYYCSTKVTKDDLNINYLKIFEYQKYKSILKLISYLYSMFTLYFYLIKAKHDIIHIQWFRLPFLEIPCLYFINKFVLGSKPLVYTAHNIYPHDSGSLFRWVYKFIYRVFDTVIVHDETTKRKLEKLTGHNKIKVIHCGTFILEPIDEVEDDVRRAIRRSNSGYVLVFGNAGYYKGADILLETWRQSGLDKLGVRLVIAGNGYDQFINKSEIPDSVTLISRFISESSLASLIENCTFVLLPYREISQSGVLMTVISYKKPALVTYVGAFRDLIDTFKPKMHLRNFSTVEIGKSCFELFTDVDKQIEFLNYDKITDEYSWSSASEATFHLYASYCISKL
jgi:D-inositol-3-phosphate glycosyltransferase